MGLNEATPIIIEFTSESTLGEIQILAQITSNEDDYVQYEVELPFVLEVNDAAVLDNKMQQAISQRSQIELNKYENRNVNDLAKKIPQLNSSKSNLDAAKANYERSLLNLNKTSIKAPFRGRIKNTHSSKGMIIAKGTQLATIYSVDDLILKLPLQLDEVDFLNSCLIWFLSDSTR